MRRQLILLCVLALFPILSSRAAAAEVSPSVLVLAEWTGMDFNYLQALHRRGFALDYDGDWTSKLKQGKLDAHLQRYNVVVLTYTTSIAAAGEAALTATLAKFAENGGGVLLMPDTVNLSNDEIDSLIESQQKSFGAAVLKGLYIVDENPENLATGGMKSPHYQWTDNVVAHDLTRGVSGIWYNVDTSHGTYRCHTESLDIVDPAWTVLLKAAKSAHTITIPEKFKRDGGKLNPAEYPSGVKRYDAEPPLMAVRTFGKGRLVYFPVNPLQTWCAGYYFQHGGGVDDNTPGYALGGTLRGRTSGLETLIDHSLRWLAAPSLAAGTPGGYVQDAARLQDPRVTPDKAHVWDNWKFEREATPNEAKTFERAPFRGLIGARTTFSDGKSSPEEMAKAARAGGLDFLVFLERFDLLTPANWTVLKAECARLSDETFVALPGYTVDSNRNHSLFLFGRELILPPAAYLTKDGKRVDFSATPEHSGLSSWITFALGDGGKGIQVGYYHFTAPAPAGETRAPMHDLRLYAAVGLYYYEDGKLVEGPKENYDALKDVNDLFLCIPPMVVDIVRDPAQLTAAAAEHELSCITASTRAKAAQAIPSCLAYTYRGGDSLLNVSPTQGPQIRRWLGLNSGYTPAPSRRWQTPNYRWRVEMLLTSEVGLDTIEVWDGVELFQRYKANGAKEFYRNLDINNDQQRQLLLVVTDTQGRTAYSGGLWNVSMVSSHYFCSDRINGALFHGPYGDPRLGFGEQRGREWTVKGYDSSDPNVRSQLWFHTYLPPWDLFAKEQGMHGIGGCRPVMDFHGDDAHKWSTLSDFSYPTGEHIIHAWYTYGPLLRRKNTGTVGWQLEECGELRKSESLVSVLTDGAIQFAPSTFIDDRMMGVIPGNTAVFACSAGPNKPVYEFNVRRQMDQLYALANSDFRIGKGGFIACYGTLPGSGACNVYFLDDYQRKLLPNPSLAFMGVETFPAGTAYKASTTLRAKTLQIVGKAPKQNGGWWYQWVGDWLGLDGAPDIKLTLKTGSQLPATEGFCDLDIGPAGYADMTFAPDQTAPLQTLGIRLKGGCSRWTLMEYRPQLPVVMSVFNYWYRYSDPIPRDVPDGLKPLSSHLDIGYLQMELPTPDSDPVHSLAGHPVTASDRRVFVTVTALSWKPYTYAVQVNNPTDEALTVTLKPGLPLPNFPFTAQTLALQPGEWKEVFRNGK